MKRIVALLALLLLALLCVGGASAEDLGIQIIGGPDVNTQPLTLDDLQLGQTYTIDGYAQITPQEYLMVDYFAQFKKDLDYFTIDGHAVYDYVYIEEQAVSGGFASCYRNASWIESGENADFVWFRADVTNLQKSSVAYLGESSVKVVYADDYEFAGWIRQINYDYTDQVYRYSPETAGGPYAVIDPANEEAIEMLYTGTYIFGCTLPNYVVEDKASPLKMVIDLGGNELTYHIRK